MTHVDRLYEVIRGHVLTEKGTDDSAKRNAYHFRVPLGANKVEIRQAVQKLFNVKVERVNTLRVKPKVRRRGRIVGETQAWKKAMVVLAEGQTIELL